MKVYSNLILNKDIEYVEGNFEQNQFNINQYKKFSGLDSDMDFKTIMELISEDFKSNFIFRKKFNLVLSINDFKINFRNSDLQLSKEDLMVESSEDMDLPTKVLYRGFNFYKKQHEYLLLSLENSKINYLKDIITKNNYKNNLLTINNYCDFLLIQSFLNRDKYNPTNINIAILNIEPESVLFTIIRKGNLYNLKEFDIDFKGPFEHNIDTLDDNHLNNDFSNNYETLLSYLKLEMKLFSVDNEEDINLLIVMGSVSNITGLKTSISKKLNIKVIDISEFNSNIAHIVDDLNCSTTSLGVFLYG